MQIPVHLLAIRRKADNHGTFIDRVDQFFDEPALLQAVDQPTSIAFFKIRLLADAPECYGAKPSGNANDAAFQKPQINLTLIQVVGHPLRKAGEQMQSECAEV